MKDGTKTVWVVQAGGRGKRWLPSHDLRNQEDTLLRAKQYVRVLRKEYPEKHFRVVRLTITQETEEEI